MADKLTDLRAVSVVKRDGRRTKYNTKKIYRAIYRASKGVHNNPDMIAESITESVENRLKRDLKAGSEVTVDKIQSLVEFELMKSMHKGVATAYIEYRSAKDRDRAGTTDINVTINRLLSKDKKIVNENANKDSKTFTTNRDLTAGVVAKTTGLSLLPKAVANAHLKGDIHYHDLDYQPYSPMTNCFSRDTEFVTINGVESFYAYEDGDTTTVLTPNGNWKRATVRCYGKQKLNSVILRKGSSAPKELHVTGNHRWLLKDGTETTSLGVGDLLRGVSEPDRLDFHDLQRASNEYIEGWVRGFVYGDGSTYSKNGSRIRLCGSKIKYKDIFERAGYRVSSTADYLDGDILMSNHTVPKQMLTDNDSLVTKEAFINGWIEADGSFRNGNTDYKTVITIGEFDDVAHFKKLSATAKYHIVGESDLTGQVTNFGTRSATKTLRLSHGNYFTWKVIDIVENVYEDYVWCLEVEDEKAFTLSGGVPTGNCCLIDFKGMLANGFTMGNADIETPRSITTASAQVAQIIANVASNQYGGCSFNRMDEVLAPYAQLSFLKHIKNIENDLSEAVGDLVDWEEYIESRAIKRTIKEIHDAMQGLEYEVNTLFSSNGQTPFVTFNFGLGTGQWEREIQKAILEVRIKGLGKEGRTAIFPKLVMGIKKGVNFSPNDPNYDIKQLALECATKRMYPDILNYDKLVELTGSYKAPMGK